MPAVATRRLCPPLISHGLPFICKRSCWSYRSLGMVRLTHRAFTMFWRVPKMCMSSWLSRPSHTPKFQLDLNLHLMGPMSRKITVSPKGTTWLGYSVSMCLASESFMNPSCMACKPIEDRMDRRQKLKLIGVQNAQQKNPAIGLYRAMKLFRQTQGLFTLLGGCPSHASGELWRIPCPPRPGCCARGPTVGRTSQRPAAGRSYPRPSPSEKIHPLSS